jgi:hypothetical protein
LQGALRRGLFGCRHFAMQATGIGPARAWFGRGLLDHK